MRRQPRAVPTIGTWVVKGAPETLDPWDCRPIGNAGACARTDDAHYIRYQTLRIEKMAEAPELAQELIAAWERCDDVNRLQLQLWRIARDLERRITGLLCVHGPTPERPVPLAPGPYSGT